MTVLNDDVICPHCFGRCIRPYITNDDYDIDDECPHCGRLFHIEVVVVEKYRTSVIDIEARREQAEDRARLAAKFREELAVSAAIREAQEKHVRYVERTAHLTLDPTATPPQPPTETRLPSGDVIPACRVCGALLLKYPAGTVLCHSCGNRQTADKSSQTGVQTGEDGGRKA